MFKKLGVVGLALAITLTLASEAMADLKFYGGNMTGNIVINPEQGLVVTPGMAIGTQGLAGFFFNNYMDIATNPMYAVVADNQYLSRATSGALDKDFSQRQVVASHDAAAGGIYKSSGLQTTGGGFQVTSFDNAILNGNNGNIQFDARGANPSLTFFIVTQEVIDQDPTWGPRMNQMNNETAIIGSPGIDATAPLSLITTGDAKGRVIIGGGITSNTVQSQEFSSLLDGSAGLYKGEMTKANRINMSSLTQVGTGSVAIP